MSVAQLESASQLDPKLLVSQLKKVRQRLEDDLRERATTVLELGSRLDSEYQAAWQANRTREPFLDWSENTFTQAAVAWILAGVFVRFLEDNELIAPILSGPGDRRQRASDREEEYFRTRPTDSYRDYLQDVFAEVAALPGAERLFDRRHNPLWAYSISGDAAKELVQFWRHRDPDSNDLVHDFTDPNWDTRFLGDLYQDLSDAARKRYALLQTPEFVEEFILDRTLDPAIEEFGLAEVRLIDPTCGSGHFLLGAFHRILDRWFREEPGTPERALVQRALDAVTGVDLNPYAVAIARFRLTIAALKASRIKRLKDAPGYSLNVATGDSLLHGSKGGQLDIGGEVRQAKDRGLEHAYFAEDHDEVYRLLSARYHAVVGNPPYDLAEDPAVRAAIKDRYSAAYGKCPLAVPFTERFFDLALKGPTAEGYVGLINSNGFMKREYGKRLVETFLTGVDLTHVIDTFYVWFPPPGFRTPTAILFGRHRPPATATVRVVMGSKGETGTPASPEAGLYWQDILAGLDHPGFASELLSVADVQRERLKTHPWSLRGGGAADLREVLEQRNPRRLDHLTSEIGITSVPGEDPLFVFGGEDQVRRHRVERTRGIVAGEMVRDWGLGSALAVWLYDDERLLDLGSLPMTARLFWPYRSVLDKRKRFGTPMLERGCSWYEYQELYWAKLRTPLTIAFADLEGRNHFVLDRSEMIFNRSAPVIKLPASASLDDHLGLLGPLNSSVACFWGRQVLFSHSSPQHSGWDDGLRWDATKLAKLPLPADFPLDLAKALAEAAEELSGLATFSSEAAPTHEDLAARRLRAKELKGRMIALQEELDWRCYYLYGLLPEPLECPEPLPLDLGHRAFEIAMARQMAAGELETSWFERHQSTPTAEMPPAWPEEYRAIIERRIQLMESDPYIGLIERPECKRRWAGQSWEHIEKKGLRNWLLDRLELPDYWPDLRPRSTR